MLQMRAARNALRMGLINQVVAQTELEVCTRPYALTIAQNAPLTIRAAKLNGQHLFLPAEQRNLTGLERLRVDCINSEDYREGVRAFSEKYQPQFQGR